MAAQEGIDETLMFYLKTALLYARLLDAVLEPMHVRSEKYAELAADYNSIVDEYPNATLPLLRLDFVATQLGQNEIASNARTRAMELVDDDKYYPRDIAGAPHWLQRFVRRRYSMSILARYPEASLRWRSDRTGSELYQSA